MRDNQSLEVLLSILKLHKKDLKKMNITTPCTVINQCNKQNYEKYLNYDIYNYNELGTAKSRNRGLQHIKKDIIALCDDDVIYKEDFEKIIIQEFEKHPESDIITFNLDSPYRKTKMNKKNKRLHIYNILKYSSSRIVFRKSSILNKYIKFNELFGPGAIYTSGEDTLFLVDSLKSGLKIYASTKNIGTVNHIHSSWFKGYNDKYFFDKGALFTAISHTFRHFLFVQYLLRNREVLTNISFIKAYHLMKLGSYDYLNRVKRK